jgi:cobalt-zinc-cadmium resistance protein CzcA
MAEFYVDVKPQDQWRRKISKESLIEDMNQALEKLPGMEPSFSQPIRDNVLESISQIDGQIVVKLFSTEPEVLRNKTREILRELSGVRGVARAFIDRAGETPQLKIEIDRERAARHGLNVADIEDVIETSVGGKEATQIWEGEKKFGVAVRLAEDLRSDPDQLRKLVIDAPNGSRIPLEDVAHLSVLEGSMNISRELGRRVASIGIFIHDRDMGSIVQEMQDRVKGNIKLPAGSSMTWGGEFENQQRAMKRLAVIVPISVLLIFVLLFEAFGSVRSALLILLNVPFALIGGIVALWLTGIHLSVSAAIGFIALFGQAVLNGVVMVSYFNELRDKGRRPYEAVLEGSLVRLRTVSMTSLLAMLGLLPMALSHGIGSEVQRPLATVIIGGLITATTLTLFLLPTLYLAIESRATRPTPGTDAAAA